MASPWYQSAVIQSTQAPIMVNRLICATASVLGIAALANGIFMIVAPESWYWQITGVADRGPFNQHFLRDIGFIYLLSGIAFLYGARHYNYRLQLWLLPTGWLVSHALFHLWEILTGICGPEALWDDFIGVTLPAVTAAGLLYLSHKVQPNA